MHFTTEGGNDNVSASHSGTINANSKPKVINDEALKNTQSKDGDMGKLLT